MENANNFLIQKGILISFWFVIGVFLSFGWFLLRFTILFVLLLNEIPPIPKKFGFKIQTPQAICKNTKFANAYRKNIEIHILIYDCVFFNWQFRAFLVNFTFHAYFEVERCEDYLFGWIFFSAFFFPRKLTCLQRFDASKCTLKWNLIF